MVLEVEAEVKTAAIEAAAFETAHVAHTFRATDVGHTIHATHVTGHIPAEVASLKSLRRRGASHA